MIFLSVGTHEQQFDRLIKETDRLKGEDSIAEDVFAQIGYSSFVPQHCAHEKMIGYKEMLVKAKACRIYITHGGPGSIFLGFQLGKVPIVVPRMHRFGEHVDDHQISFTKKLEKEGRIIAVYDIADLKGKILNYDTLAKKCTPQTSSNVAILSLVNKLDSYCRKISCKR